MRTATASVCVALFLSATACSSPDPAVSAPEPVASAAAEPDPTAAPGPAAVSAPTAVAGGMAAVLDTANIGRRLDIFERVAGAPIDAGKDSASYKVEDCTVHVTTEEGVISWIEFQVGYDDCTADIEPVLGQSLIVGKSNPLTFAKLDEILEQNTHYTFPCPGIDCGNHFEPYVMLVKPAAHVTGFIAVQATSSMADQFDAYFEWKKQVQEAAGDEGYDLNLECDRRFDELSRRLLATAPIESIGFGHRKPLVACE